MTPQEIKALRTQAGMNQQTFAQTIGVSYGAVSAWERNKSKPSPLALQALNHFEEQQTKGG